jgi:hypothetical protein
MSITDEVLELKQKHIATWRDKPEWFWMLSLLEEVAELGLSLIGLHAGPPDWELKQIVAICLNWLEMRQGK